MSKAFTKEEGAIDEAGLRPQGPSLPPGAKNYMTPLGAEKIRDELNSLLNAPLAVKRDEQRRIVYLQRRVDELQIIDPVDQNSEQVRFGATVQVRDEEGNLRVYRIVGVDEADPKLGRISWISPLATALIGLKCGDQLTFRTPRKEEDLEIVRVVYEPIEGV